MPFTKFCTCGSYECPYHPSKHDGGCNACVEKNLAEHEIPSCFFSKIGEAFATNSGYTFYRFAEKVIACEAGDKGGGVNA